MPVISFREANHPTYKRKGTLWVRKDIDRVLPL